MSDEQMEETSEPIRIDKWLWAAIFRNGSHNDCPFERSLPNVECLAGPDIPARLGARAVDFNFAAGDRLDGE